MLNPSLVKELAAALGINPDLIEKDWHVVRALGVLASLDHIGASPVFSGGTSLSKGWGLIKRFSEDIDFKVDLPFVGTASQGRGMRREYREKVIATLRENGFSLADPPLIGNESRFFAADFSYESMFPPGQGLRPHIRLEMSFQKPALPSVNRPIQSLIAKAQKHPPEVSEFPCVVPIETAADKLSALAWRVCRRQRGSENDDPAMIRHLYDLATLEPVTKGEPPQFAELVKQAVANDADKKRVDAPQERGRIFADMLRCLKSDPLWEKDYKDFVLQVSFAEAHEQISFAEALAATARLVALIS